MNAFFSIGRALFGGFFLCNGLNHFRNVEAMAAYARSRGTPDPEAAVLGSGALLIAGGTSILTGIRPKDGIAAIVSFLVPVTLQMHRFWDVPDPAMRQSEQVNFLKNVALVGAALMLTAIPDPWPGSVRVRQEPVVRGRYPVLPARAIEAPPA